MRFTKKTYSLVVGAAVLLLGLLGVLSQSDSCSLFGKITGSYACKPSVILPDGYVYVVNVVDGDTFDVSIDGKTQRVRVLGVNTPETVDPRKPVECFGKEASDKAKELLYASQGVRLEVDSTQDAVDMYGRLLRHVFLRDGQNFALEMIGGGYAYEYTYKTPSRYQEEYAQAQRDAKAVGAGLWAEDSCSGGE
jgi:micrococcal nuclease